MQEGDQASPKQMTGKKKKERNTESVKNERKEGSVAYLSKRYLSRKR